MSSIYGEPAVVKRIEYRTEVRKFTSNGTIAAAVMVMAALVALVVANSPAHEAVEKFFEWELSVQVGVFAAHMSFETFVNDFLMAIFFLLVGIELKYEVTVGQLRRPRQAMLPMLAAAGGVVVPACVYLLCNYGGAMHGWATPIATDIAFALGVMSLLGNRISSQTKVFFQTLAIADDILAIVVIALFYGQTPSIAWCAAALGVILILWGMSRMKLYTSAPYLVAGLVLWVCMYHSGIHATLAGVILAFFLPSRSDVRLNNLGGWLESRARDLNANYDDEHHILGQHDFTRGALRVEQVMHHVTPPLQRVERYISVPVNFLILPLFAFANAQVTLMGSDFGAIIANPVAYGTFFGAIFGKPAGIILTTLVLVKLGVCKLPKRVSWTQVIAVGLMGGLGFTMSILISGLAFNNPQDILAAKCAILAGSFVAGLLGIVFIRIVDAVHVHKTLGEKSKSSKK
ncbi:Na+/H+ antiporter NhaA [Atopobium sp. oral taxon 199]|uniref:Na+/H+ antiporter NhaA n=1 Tax=Atopobium sp. oral taxon 199 TaxID=712156 RepID=UPI00034E878A|nr:Na+/H+ antiporter NhaA [Atopobium sp. oral taxon 199]EPD78373.1 Na+/H+ antiporter NhaA [Atopobium sp. oral taxon 199 str. F0494]